MGGCQSRQRDNGIKGINSGVHMSVPTVTEEPIKTEKLTMMNKERGDFSIAPTYSFTMKNSRLNSQESKTFFHNFIPSTNLIPLPKHIQKSLLPSQYSSLESENVVSDALKLKNHIEGPLLALSNYSSLESRNEVHDFQLKNYIEGRLSLTQYSSSESRDEISDGQLKTHIEGSLLSLMQSPSLQSGNKIPDTQLKETPLSLSQYSSSVSRNEFHDDQPIQRIEVPIASLIQFSSSESGDNVSVIQCKESPLSLSQYSSTELRDEVPDTQLKKNIEEPLSSLSEYSSSESRDKVPDTQRNQVHQFHLQEITEYKSVDSEIVVTLVNANDITSSETEIELYENDMPTKDPTTDMERITTHFPETILPKSLPIPVKPVYSENQILTLPFEINSSDSSKMNQNASIPCSSHIKHICINNTKCVESSKPITTLPRNSKVSSPKNHVLVKNSKALSNDIAFNKNSDFCTSTYNTKASSHNKPKLIVRGLKRYIESRGGSSYPPSWVKDFPCKSKFHPDNYIYEWEDGGPLGLKRNVEAMRKCRMKSGRCGRCGIYSEDVCQSCRRCDIDCSCPKAPPVPDIMSQALGSNWVQTQSALREFSGQNVANLITNSNLSSPYSQSPQTGPAEYTDPTSMTPPSYPGYPYYTAPPPPMYHPGYYPPPVYMPQPPMPYYNYYNPENYTQSYPSYSHQQFQNYY